MTRRVFAVLFAHRGAGRLGEGPLAFVVIRGRSLLSLSVSALEASREVQGFLIVAAPGLEGELAGQAEGSPKFVAAVPGGATRTESIRRAMDAIPPTFDVVVVHDVSRPLATPGLFDAVIGALDGADAAVPLVAVADTLKRVEARAVRETISREGLGVVQFPQAFQREVLATAQRAQREGRSGDGASLLAGGAHVVAVPGEPANVKVTTPQDARLAEALLDERLGGTVDR